MKKCETGTSLLAHLHLQPVMRGNKQTKSHKPKRLGATVCPPNRAGRGHVKICKGIIDSFMGVNLVTQGYCLYNLWKYCLYSGCTNRISLS